MWKLILTQLKMRASRPLCMFPTIAGIIAFAMYVLVVNFTRAIDYPYSFVIIPLVAGILLAIGGLLWFKQPQDMSKRTYCRNCRFDLQGHAEIPKLCPECGTKPSPLTYSSTNNTSGCISFIPGLLLIIWGIGCILAGLLFLFMWINGLFA